ncbi:MAG TPA: hypothetical protein VGE47_02945, partial [Burkholderiaceae bacterium]
MSDTPDNPVNSAADAAAPAGKAIPWMTLLIAGLAVCAVGGLGFGWQALSHQRELEKELVRRQDSSNTEAVEARTLARQAQELSRDTAAKVALLDARLAEVAMQRAQLEDLMQQLSRSRDENLIGDIEAAIH